MIERTIEEIAQYCQGKMNQAAELKKDQFIKGVSIDTRTIQEKNLFVPFKGENVDGHRFIEMAINKGAALTLSETEDVDSKFPAIIVKDGLKALQDIARSYLKEVNPKVIAVTGSNGKTTTKDMIECVLAGRFKVQKTQGNFNNEIGLPLTILQLREETEVSILEMGMDAKGDIDFLSHLAKPDLAVITSVGESHIEMLGSRENIALAKYEIVNGLKDDGTFIYSKDYPLLDEIINQDVDYTIKSAGLEASNDYQVSKVSADGEGTSFDFQGQSFKISQLGSHNALNASLAILVGETLGVPLEESKNNLQDLSVTSMRMERIHDDSGALIINDAYNASKSSMISAIETVGKLPHDKKILVLADILELGSYKKELHEAVAEYINSTNFDFSMIYTFGEASQYIHDALKTTDKLHIESIEELRDGVRECFKTDTVILLKGSRGMALERVLTDY